MINPNMIWALDLLKEQLTRDYPGYIYSLIQNACGFVGIPHGERRVLIDLLDFEAAKYSKELSACSNKELLELVGQVLGRYGE